MSRGRISRALGLTATAVALTIACTGSALAASPPAVEGVKPGKGPPAGGTSVSVTGKNFTGVTAVRFGANAAASFKVESATSITAVSPPFTGGNAIVDVTVTTPEGTSPIQKPGPPIGDLFEYGPTVTAVEPGAGPAGGGTAVTITGTGFESFCKIGSCAGPVYAVYFGSTEAESVTVNSENSITAIAPPGTGAVDVTVETGGGISPISSEDRYVYTVPPIVATEPASNIGGASALVNATVNPNGGQVSECKFEYGSTNLYGSSVPCTSSPGSGNSPVAVSAPVTGLSAGSTYHFRISATSVGGTSNGSDETFSTSAGGELCGPANSPGEEGLAKVCNWYDARAILPAGQPRVIYLYGGFASTANLVQMSPVGEISCKTMGYGTIENPIGGGAGVGKIFGMGFYSCIAPQCEKDVQEEFGEPGRATITASNLPWSESLSEGGSPQSVRDHIGVPFSGPFGAPKTGEIDVSVVCEVIASGQRVRTSNFEGALEPEIGIGPGPAPGLNAASEFNFSAASTGELESPTGQGTFTGLLKYAAWLPGTPEVW